MPRYIVMIIGLMAFHGTVKANENNLNQNFTAIAQKIEEMETRLSALE